MDSFSEKNIFSKYPLKYWETFLSCESVDDFRKRFLNFPHEVRKNIEKDENKKLRLDNFINDCRCWKEYPSSEKGCFQKRT
jgi:hypothetical protein